MLRPDKDSRTAPPTILAAEETMATPPSAERTPWIRAARMRSLLLDDPQHTSVDVPYVIHLN